MLTTTRFTERVRRVIRWAQEEAARFGQPEVGPEHLLLGLMREKDGVGARLLERLGVNLGTMRGEVERRAARGDAKPGKGVPLSPGGRLTFERAAEEGRRLDNNYIGTEHILLGLLRCGDDAVSTAFLAVGVTLDDARREIESLQ